MRSSPAAGHSQLMSMLPRLLQATAKRMARGGGGQSGIIEIDDIDARGEPRAQL